MHVELPVDSPSMYRLGLMIWVAASCQMIVASEVVIDFALDITQLSKSNWSSTDFYTRPCF